MPCEAGVSPGVVLQSSAPLSLQSAAFVRCCSLRAVWEPQPSSLLCEVCTASVQLISVPESSVCL